MRGLHQEGADLFHWSVECLREGLHGTEEDRQRIVAMCLAAQGQCSLSLSVERARSLADESLSILRRLPAGKATILALKLLESLAPGDPERMHLAQEALAIARTTETGWWLPKCIMDLGWLAMNRGDYAEVKNLVGEARSLYREMGNPALEVQALLMLSQVNMYQGIYDEARQLAQECLAVAQDMGYSAAVWWSHSAAADVALLQGDYASAQLHYQAGLNVCQELNDQQGVAIQHSGLGFAACGLRNDAKARSHLYQALQLAQRFDSARPALDVIGAMSWLLANAGDMERAVLHATYVLNHSASDLLARMRLTGVLQVAENTLPLETFAAAVEKGKLLDFDTTVQALLTELSRPPQVTTSIAAAHASQPMIDPLTERELEVLRLIVDGLSNYDIAVRLFLGVSTVKTHVNRIFSKLCVKNRTQAVARARELHLI
ncbi:MAG: response regulator transcription factor [Anaerolineae bacterium]|nr:response regulator transcription factor [Anaerolineae bacterium]